MIKKFVQFVKESKRVLKVTKRPSKEEYKTIVKVSGLGILAVGLLGFIIVIMKQLILG